MDNILDKVKESRAFLAAQGADKIDIAIVLGTGLGALVQHIDVKHIIPYNEIPHFPQATVEFHKGQLLVGSIAGTRVAVMQGRFHYYEGYSMQQITFPVRVLKALGAHSLLLSNAAGGMNPQLRKGDLVLIEDHLNFLPDNPLRGVHEAALGNRFVDMSAPYSDRLNALLHAAAPTLPVALKKGVYAAVMGPNLETRAEYRWLRQSGADMVGMSTVPEVIVANQIGLACAAVSVITDECDPDHLAPVDIQDIIAVAGRADQSLSRLFAAVAGGMG